MKNIFLSKTSYCNSLQCPKMIWLKRYKRDQAVQQADPKIFENGKKVGILAQDLFGKKHDDVAFNYNHFFKYMLEQTDEFLLNKPNIITEATFNYENNFCMVDVLKNDTDGVEIYEVKSSTKVTDVYIYDASFQYYVLSNLGFNVKKVCIVYINNQYVRQKELDIHELFNIEDITSIALEKQDEIRRNVESINQFMREHNQNDEPDIFIGKQCSKPYECDFIEYCTHFSENSRLTNYLIEESDVEEEDNATIIDKEAIKNLLDSLKYPLYFIDYETYNTPIPEIEGTRPYQQLPFQYSLHILKDENAELEHKEFLADPEDKDFIRHFAESMISNLPEDGSVIVYNQTFEGTMVNKELIRMYPDLEEEITRINSNMVDFMVPFRKKQYYTKEMQGSYSIKYVLPALYPDDPELDYINLALVHDGAEASEAFESLKDKSPEEQEKIREGLLEYCKLDTYAMVKIFDKFKEAIEK